MTELEFQQWILKYCPSGEDPEEFIDQLAIGTIKLLEAVHEKTKEPISKLVAGFYPHLNQ